MMGVMLVERFGASLRFGRRRSRGAPKVSQPRLLCGITGMFTFFTGHDSGF